MSGSLGVQMDKTRAVRTDFNRASLRGAELVGCVFSRSDARFAVFTSADLTGADFTGALLYRAVFRKADITDSSFRRPPHTRHASVCNVQGCTRSLCADP